MSRSENESAQLREQEYLEKISEMTAKIADVTSTNTGRCVCVCVREREREREREKEEGDGERVRGHNIIMFWCNTLLVVYSAINYGIIPRW